MKNLTLLAFLLFSLDLTAQNHRCDSTYTHGDTTICFYKNSINKRLHVYRYSLGQDDLFVRTVSRTKSGKVKIATRKSDDFSERHGPAWIYDAAGQLRARLYYVNDKLDGNVLLFHKNGKVSCECHYTNGKADGDQRNYYDNGQLRFHWRARNGRTVEVYEQYDTQGRPLALGTLKNGTGTLHDYNADGRLTRVIEFRDGKRKSVKRIKMRG